MPWSHPDPQRTLRARAGSKRKAAERREAEAAQLRVEADECERQWVEYLEGRDARDDADGIPA